MSFLKQVLSWGINKFARPQDENLDAVLVYLDARGLPAHIPDSLEVTQLENLLTQEIERQGLGEFDGDEWGQGELTLFMYGPDCERLFAGIEPVLRGHPLCAGGYAVLRRADPTIPERVVHL